MSPIYLDALFSYGHFFGIGALLASRGMETAIVRGDDLGGEKLKRLVTVDAAAGLSAVVILAFGAARVAYGLKGPDYYIDNHIFWTKMILFAAAALASVPPTLIFVRWRKASALNPGFLPPERERRRVRIHVTFEWILMALIPVAAVLMARGVGT